MIRRPHPGAVPSPRVRRVTVEARAKLNLTLAVGPRRPDGFHEIATVFQSVSLADTLVVTPRRRGFTLRVRHARAADAGRPRRDPIPTGRGNLVLAAARRVAHHAGLAGGARFTLIKRIPSCAGLGGASADAAAAIVGLERLYGLKLGPARLEIAAALGSDVPFALRGGTAIGSGRGDRLHPVALVKPFRAVVVLPQWRIATVNAYARLDRRKNRLTRWATYLNSLQSLGREQIRAEDAIRLGNDFEDILGRRRLQYHSLRARLRDAGVANVRMTGSGSAVFGVLESGAPARELVGRFDGIEAIYVVRSLKRGWSLSTLP